MSSEVILQPPKLSRAEELAASVPKPPTILDPRAMEATVPSASTSGKQEGRLSPAERKAAREAKRRKEEANDDLRMDAAAEMGSQVEVVGDANTGYSAVSKPQKGGCYNKEAPSPLAKYLSKRGRVSFEVDSGTYSVPAIDVKVAEFGLIILLPNTDSDATFTPKPGSSVTVHSGKERYKCYYPGVVCDFEEFTARALVFILAEQNEA
jgi:hypothetical protein